MPRKTKKGKRSGTGDENSALWALSKGYNSNFTMSVPPRFNNNFNFYGGNPGFFWAFFFANFGGNNVWQRDILCHCVIFQ